MQTKRRARICDRIPATHRQKRQRASPVGKQLLYERDSFRQVLRRAWIALVHTRFKLLNIIRIPGRAH